MGSCHLPKTFCALRDFSPHNWILDPHEAALTMLNNFLEGFEVHITIKISLKAASVLQYRGGGVVGVAAAV